MILLIFINKIILKKILEPLMNYFQIYLVNIYSNLILLINGQYNVIIVIKNYQLIRI